MLIHLSRVILDSPVYPELSPAPVGHGLALELLNAARRHPDSQLQQDTEGHRKSIKRARRSPRDAQDGQSWNLPDDGRHLSETLASDVVRRLRRVAEKCQRLQEWQLRHPPPTIRPELGQQSQVESPNHGVSVDWSTSVSAVASSAAEDREQQEWDDELEDMFLMQLGLHDDSMTGF